MHALRGCQSSMSQVCLPCACSLEVRQQPLRAKLQHFIVHLRQPVQAQHTCLSAGAARLGMETRLHTA